MGASNLINLENKRFLVTGAASGLGKATSILLSKLGAELVLIDLDENGLKETASMCINHTLLITKDLCMGGGKRRSH